MNLPTIVYFHGFRSSPSSDKFRAMPGKAKKRQKHCLHVDYDRVGFGGALALHIDHMREEVCGGIDPSGYNLMFAGHSLGAWWARYFAKMYDKPALLINPSLFPLHYEIKDVSIYNALTPHFRKSTTIPIAYYVETGDPLINHMANMKYITQEVDHHWLAIHEGGSHTVDNILGLTAFMSEFHKHIATY